MSIILLIIVNSFIKGYPFKKMKAVNLIRNISNNIDSSARLTFEGICSQFHINEGATLEEINLLKSFKTKIPEAYLALLRAFNGIDLFCVEDIGGYRFFSCTEAIGINKLQERNYADEWDDKVLLICSLRGDGDFVGLRIFETGYEILDCFHEESPKEWKTIGKSIDYFIETLINEKGRKFWLH